MLIHLQVIYKDAYDKTKDKNKFKITDTEQYKTIKDGEKALSDVSLGLLFFAFAL